MLHLFSYFVSMCVCLCVCMCMCLCMGNKYVLWTQPGKIKCDKILLMIVKFDDFLSHLVAEIQKVIFSSII